MDHERALSDRLEARAIAGSTRRLSSPRLGLRALTSAADISAVEAYAFLGSVHRVHEVDLALDCDVSTVLVLHATAGAALSPTKEFLELLKYIAEGLLATRISLPELVLEALETGEPAKSTAEAAERVSSALLLLVTCHSSAVVDAPLLIIAERLICRA